MKRTILTLTAFATLAWAGAAFAQVPSGRMVAVDLNKIFNEYYKTPIASEKLKAQADSFNKEHEDMLANYKKQIEELNKLQEDSDKPEYTPAVKEEKKKAVREKLSETQKIQKDIEEFRASRRQVLDQQTKRMREGIIKEITEVVSKEAKDAGYAYVFDKSGTTLNGVPSIVYVQDSLDITDEILKILNKNAPKPVETPKADEKKPEKPADKK